MSYYRTALASIHDDGFGQLASAGAELLIDLLHRRGLDSGTVCEFGCGSGITARELTGRGYSLIGSDLSEALIQIARERVPEATFRIGSFVEMDVPPCIAVCAIGEVLNYTFDSRSSATTRQAFFERAFRALVAGGVLLFDAAGPDRAPDHSTRTFVEGQDWAILVETSAEADVLTRRIVTFRQSGSAYERDSETHRLHLIAPGDIEAQLRAVGFEVERLGGYGAQAFPRGLHGFLAWRPEEAA
jgi:SAM-dependent methyltransferase